MPYYGMPVGLEIDGEPIEEVGFGYNRQVVTGLLREKLGYDGVVVTDWELVNDNHVGDQVLPARAWGVEHLDPHGRMELILDAGADQFGGEECVDVLLDLVAQGRVTEARVDESARRILAVKFRLGLFDDPYVDEDAAAARRWAARTSATPGTPPRPGRSPCCSNGGAEPAPSCRSRAGLRIYAENVSPRGRGPARDPGRPRRRTPTSPSCGSWRPSSPRSDLFLESWFHQGSLDFPPGLVARLRRIAAQLPARRRRRARPAGGAHAAAAGRRGRGRQLRHQRRRARSTR